MKRLVVALTLLLLPFLATVDQMVPLHRLLAKVGVQRWMTELVLAAGAVALFAHVIQLNRRMLFPRRGLRLLLAGIALYAVGLALMVGLPDRAMGVVSNAAQAPWSGLPGFMALLRPLPLLAVAQALLLVGAFRALTNLVPPDEFAEDF
jgi:hypothetical protein